MEKIPAVHIQEMPPVTLQEGKFHVRLTKGFYQNLRRLTSWPLLALFFGAVWIQHDGQPWILFSFHKSHMTLFGNPLSWQELPLLAGLMIACAFLLFFVSVAWGRVWCGFACPQSIWTWLFIRIEDFTEGKASKRAREESKPFTLARILRRAAKHILWMALALVTATTFSGYFVPIREIVGGALDANLSITTASWIAIMAALTYLNAGLVREKICLHACPYSRFQSVMFDNDTKTVSYDALRGEPRANRRKGEANSGDCVDCELCVQVCPVGIDIRNGLQAACIDCGACIDACNTVMMQLDRPKGLIRFASEAELQGKKSPFIRPRLASYAAVLAGAFAVVFYGFTDTAPLNVDIKRDRGSLYRVVNGDTVCNVYLVQVEGYIENQRRVNISVSGEGEFQLFGPTQIILAADDPYWQPYRVCTKATSKPKQEIIFTFNAGAVSTSKTTNFLSPK
ncbi:cytochrome c oxidase accessory protein CcoG [Marinagarivorans cellulosilyticus]|uniref:4Fe-4S ferredoxin-type domain-containing protein n=1 Tax=Marinagarivorans cellulosilyticus TaxID=2721545 RepID=A0AAN1WE17_9GAMM|nr:cytochrome c oxidase accessory protein CcoG [Marinagarivorans cellulosilyticus]BCD95872.1 hypothetical protein MARGE09_P0071 [Marinagarivorans cellulosilyticus]